MRLFAVRVTENKQPVGFFWARTSENLWDMVDSICDPGHCEYVRITAETAVIWESNENWRMGEVDPKIADDEDGFLSEKRLKAVRRGLDFDGSLAHRGTLMDFVCGHAEVGGWKKLPYFDEAGSPYHRMLQERRKPE